MRSNNCLLAKRRLLAALSAPLILILGSAVAQSASPPHKIQRHSTESVLLYLWAAPVDFSEYRGLQLGEEGGETKFDATLIPDDWTQTPECAVSQGPYEAGMMYRYSCAATFPLLSDPGSSAHPSGSRGSALRFRSPDLLAAPSCPSSHARSDGR